MFDKIWRLCIIILLLAQLCLLPENHGWSRVMDACIILFCLNELFLPRMSQGTVHQIIEHDQ